MPTSRTTAVKAAGIFDDARGSCEVGEEHAVKQHCDGAHDLTPKVNFVCIVGAAGRRNRGLRVRS